MTVPGGRPHRGRLRSPRLPDARSAWPLALLVAAATLVGHDLGYLAAGIPESAASGHVHTEAAPFHEYLATVRAVVQPIGTLALIAAALGHARSDGPWPELRTRHLAVPQLVLYTAMELGERVADGGKTRDTLGSALWLGLAAQLLVASVLVLLLRWVDRLTVGLTLRPYPARAGGRPLLRASQTHLSPHADWCALSRRGPPVIVPTR